MRAKVFTLNTSATGATPWHRLDDKQNPFSVSFAVTVQGTGTYTVEHGFTNWVKNPVTLSRSTTTATLSFTAHGLQVGDSVVVEGAGAPFDGTYAVASVVDANNITYTVANSGATASSEGRAVFIRVFPHAVVAAQTTSKDGNYAYPAQVIRCRCTVSGAGQYAFTVSQGAQS